MEKNFVATTKTWERFHTRLAGEWRATSGQQTRQVVPSPYFRWKHAVDRCMAAILLVPALPVIGLLVLLVRLTSRGPGIYRQVRVGKDGRLFTMYKIRSMAADAEVRSGAVWARKRDPRVTGLGRFLRALHLDELPQLFNVLRGEMSLVGPRPERPEFVEMLSARIPGYCDRLAVPPGITGLAQLNLPPDTDLNSVRRKLFLDLEYVACGGLAFDVCLLLCTVFRATKIPGRLVLPVFRLCREVPDCVCGTPPAGGSFTPTAPAFVQMPLAGQSEQGNDRTDPLDLVPSTVTAGGQT